MSSRSAESLRIDSLCPRQYRLAEKPVRVGFDRVSRQQVDRPAYYPGQLFLDFDVIGEVPLCVGIIADQKVDVAVGTEVVAKDGAKNGKLLDLPLAAEVADRLGIKVDAVNSHEFILPPGYDAVVLITQTAAPLCAMVIVGISPIAPSIWFADENLRNGMAYLWRIV
jgi:hypothetical protein